MASEGSNHFWRGPHQPVSLKIKKVHQFGTLYQFGTLFLDMEQKQRNPQNGRLEMRLTDHGHSSSWAMGVAPVMGISTLPINLGELQEKPSLRPPNSFCNPPSGLLKKRSSKKPRALPQSRIPQEKKRPPRITRQTNLHA